MAKAAKTPAAEQAPTTNKLERHELSEFFSLPVTVEERTELGKDIARNGQHYEILLYEDKVLDGWERYMACLQHGVTPKFKQYTGGDPEAAAFGANNLRRKLTTVQRALSGARYAARMEQRKVGHKMSQADIAKSVGCSLTRMNQLLQVVREKDGKYQKLYNQISERIELTSNELQGLLQQAGIVDAETPSPGQARPRQPEGANHISPEAAFAATMGVDYDPDSAVDDLIGSAADDLLGDDDDSPRAPAAKSAKNGDNVVSLPSRGSPRLDNNRKSFETPSSTLSKAYGNLTEADRMNFCVLAWPRLRIALEQALDSGKLQWDRAGVQADAAKAVFEGLADTVAPEAKKLAGKAAAKTTKAAAKPAPEAPAPEAPAPKGKAKPASKPAKPAPKAPPNPYKAKAAKPAKGARAAA